MADNAIRPKLSLHDAAAAIEFYRRTLDAAVLSCFEMGDRIAFAELEILGTSITLKDADETDPAPAPGERGPILDVVVDDPDTVASRLTAAGAEIIFPIADQPYGARGGRVVDPYGVQWLLQTPVQMTAQEWDELVQRMDHPDDR